ncbi:MAG: hypothetical protein AAF911_08105 [Planctomycetota bacterium]
MNTANDSSPTKIYRRAWIRWALLAGASVLGMAAILPFAESMQINAKAWFIAPTLWLLLAVPATIGVYGHCFRDRSTGDDGPRAGASAEDYLRGMTSVWSVLAVGVGLSLAACLLAGSASPGIWPGALMLMLLVLARPTSGPGLA